MATILAESIIVLFGGIILLTSWNLFIKPNTSSLVNILGHIAIFATITAGMSKNFFEDLTDISNSLLANIPILSSITSAQNFQLSNEAITLNLSFLIGILLAIGLIYEVWQKVILQKN
jgi:vacuolar-type H+-ATPase subunit I/STV1